MNLRHLEHWLALADTGSFSRAAEQLHLTQPALSRSIAALEQELGGRLFDRIGKRNELTPLGQAVLARARHVVLEAEELRRVHPEAQVVFVGGRRGLEATAVPEAGFPLRQIATAGFPRRQYWRWPWAALVNLVGFCQAFALVLFERPGAVLGTGGYVSGPVALAAKLLGIPRPHLYAKLDEHGLSGLAREPDHRRDVREPALAGSAA